MSSSTSGPLSQIRQEPPVHDGKTMRLEEKQPPLSTSAVNTQRERGESTLNRAPGVQEETESCWLVCCLYSVFVAPLVALWNCLCCCCCTRELSFYEGTEPGQISAYLNGQNPDLYAPDDQGIPPIRHLTNRRLREQIALLVSKASPRIIHQGNVALFNTVCDCLEGTQEIDQEDAEGIPLTHRLFHEGHYGALLLLLQMGADVNAADGRNQSDRLLHLICRNENGNISVGGWLLIEWVLGIDGVDTNVLDQWEDTPIHKAIAHGHTAYVQHLAEHPGFRVLVPARNPHRVPCRASEIINKAGDTPLLAACKRGNLEMMQGLRRCGGNIHAINKKGDTCLHIICKMPRPKGTDPRPALIAYLHKHGALVQRHNRNGFGPQHIAASNDDYGLFGPLRAAGGDLGWPTERGWAPIHVAAANHAAAAVQLLIQDYGIDVNGKCTGTDQETPLALAYRSPLQPMDVTKSIPALETIAQLLHLGASNKIAGNDEIRDILNGEKGANAIPDILDGEKGANAKAALERLRKEAATVAKQKQEADHKPSKFDEEELLEGKEEKATQPRTLPSKDFVDATDAIAASAQVNLDAFEDDE